MLTVIGHLDKGLVQYLEWCNPLIYLYSVLIATFLEMFRCDERIVAN